jgi:putative ABC transport system permease protein
MAYMTLQNHYYVFNNLIKYSIRSFKRQRVYIIINVLGLSIGIACSLLIALYILHEASYDRYNLKENRIFNLVLDFKIGEQEFKAATSSTYAGPEMMREFPEIEDFLRMTNVWAEAITYNNQIFSEGHIIKADSSFFNFFSIPVLSGDPGNLLNAPGKAVVSESTAKRIFGYEDPIGKVFKIGKDSLVYTVTGVMADIPGNTHFESDILISFMSDKEAYDTRWSSTWLNTYLLLKPNTNYKALDKKIPKLITKFMGPESRQRMNMSFDEFLSEGNRFGYYLQRLKDIHLDTTVQPHFKAAGDPKSLKILGSIAILILIIAAINFTNLSTAQASLRAKEVGIKKIGGSSRGLLIAQFLVESVILSFVSTIISLIIIKVILPYFNDLVGTNLQVNLLTPWYIIPLLLLFSFVSGILAGSYPSFYLSSFNPYQVLKGNIKNSIQNGRLRKILVVFQFTVSIFLIASTMIMYRQIIFMLGGDPGFNINKLIVLENAEALGNQIRSFKESLKAIEGIVIVSASTSVPGRNNYNNGYMLEGKKSETILLRTNWIDNDYLDTYGMTLLSGRSFNDEYTTDKNSCIVNEAGIKKYNLDPGKTRIVEYLDSGKVKYFSIIGVVKDFTYESLRNQIGPFIFRSCPDNICFAYLTVKLATDNSSKVIGEIENLWQQFTANEPLKYFFVDETFKQMYIKEKQNARMAIISSILAIFVAALGLFGLTSFTVEQRTKEIGVRRAMGSSIIGIYIEISKETIILVSISAFIAWPVIYYFAGKWLENFYYKINLGVFSFVASLTIALGIAILTMSYRVLKAARINPAQSLKYE